jgi:large subunit ribosomal protein L15
LPKRGFNPLKKEKIAVINLGKSQSNRDSKKMKSGEKSDLDLLKKLKLINKKSYKIKILGTGCLKDKIDLEVDFVSKSVKVKLDNTGSAVKIKNS